MALRNSFTAGLWIVAGVIEVKSIGFVLFPHHEVHWKESSSLIRFAVECRRFWPDIAADSSVPAVGRDLYRPGQPPCLERLCPALRHVFRTFHDFYRSKKRAELAKLEEFDLIGVLGGMFVPTSGARGSGRPA